MTARWVAAAAVVLCVAVLGVGCGPAEVATVDTSCAQMRAQVGLFRRQAVLIVDRERVQVRAGSSAQAALGVELALRRACRHAPGAYRPFREAVAARPSGFIQAP
jgi:hypothetical protein